MKPTVGAILVAAGSSSRMGFDKLWAPLGGQLVLSYPLETLASSPDIDQLALVVARRRVDDARSLTGQLCRSVAIAVGGMQRRDSVAAGLAELGACSWILIHDAARPFLSQGLIAEGLRAAQESGAAVAALPSSDTTKRVVNGTVVETLPRHEVWRVQTPQIFRANLLREALRSSAAGATDEATLVERMGVRVRVFQGSELNFKLTTSVDLELASAWLAARQANVVGRTEVDQLSRRDPCMGAGLIRPNIHG
jgi:2-C-methyl-D-erythritol 4-phosphate cytidylyltransferase